MKWSDYRLLLVDDEPDILEFLSYNLKNEGFVLYTATNGIDALKVAKEVKPASKSAWKEIKAGSKKAWSDTKKAFHKK